MRWSFTKQALDERSWVDTFCAGPGNSIFVKVPASYINDNFNLAGLRHLVPQYDRALETIRGQSVAANADVERSAHLLYGLVHKRFITTTAGLAQVRERFLAAAYGRCPRQVCRGCALLPVAVHEKPGILSVKFYCASCNDVYHPASEGARFSHIDGAFFGQSLPGAFLLAYPELRPGPPRQEAEKRVYGFRVFQPEQEPEQGAELPSYTLRAFGFQLAPENVRVGIMGAGR